ncbi:hypothetical protein STCU_07267 [Strigomonas culicis]|uniref:Uncharacterized protein n=1 Tax=Strigomonas culicis TaxID=28005 RepID=S9U675_9TRYP|nr:hypothetical protein STCU_07267 [Strigomonas culicis]|eukprot:EPY24264.1 hypothetical protein STCU_07267 [Strigomonas culicis]
MDETIILEDTINSDTPFVGENCCIVWNSFEQQLSLCLMYASEEGYSASWSALVALQDKAYPPIRFDLLQRCHLLPTTPGTGNAEKQAAKEANRAALLPYSYIIHDKYAPPLGFIEQHALSLSLMENQHLTNPVLYEDKDTVIALISLANADVLEQLLTPEVFPLLLSGGISSGDSDATKTIVSGGAKTTAWEIPDGLINLTVPEELTKLIQKDLRLNYLREEVLKPSQTRTEVLMKLTTISHRIRNELTCALLSSDVTLQQARDALLVMPVVQDTAARSMRPDTSFTSFASDNGPMGRCTTPVLPETGGASTEPARIEQQITQHLHFFRSLVALSLSELGRDLVGPVIVKVFQCGLLEALSLVAERFGMPSGSAASFLNYLSNEKGEKQARSTTPNAYSPTVAHELTLLLDITLVRLNERQEEQLMNDIVRSPILAEPVKYNGLVTFVLRQLVVGGMSSLKHVLRDYNGIRNPFLLYHILGLHDDEGSAAAERALDPESATVRHRFHHFIITKYLMHASRGLVAPVPQPPNSTTKSAPIVQFSNMPVNGTSLLQQLPQGISPHFVRMLEYLTLLTNAENRELLLKMIFNNKSHVLQFIESTFTLALKSRAIGLDILAGNVRFLKMIIAQLSLRAIGVEDSPLGVFASPVEPLSKPLVTLICRQLTVERDTFESVLKAYAHLGGCRQYSVFHCSVNALLDMISKAPLDTDEPGQNNIRDVRDYVFLKHQDLMPQRFRARFKQSLMEELCLRLGKDINSCVNESVSVLSSTASEVLRSSTKLRFVDEVEAAVGGVDGSVPAIVSGLNPNVVSSVAHEEMNRKRSHQHAQATVEQWSPSHATRLPTCESVSPPPAASVERKNSGGFAVETPPKAASAPPAQPMERAVSTPPLKPTAPKAEKPAAHRPRSANSDVPSERVSGETTLPAARATSPVEPDTRLSVTPSDPVVLPKIKKRVGSGNGSLHVNSGNTKPGKSV